MKFSRHLVLALVLVFALTLLTLLPAQAATRSGLSFRLDCTGFTSRGGGITLDRDNTGAGLESITLSAVDGAGSTILPAITSTSFVGSTIVMRDGQRWSWTATPAANPLILTVVSNAGNGLSETTVYQAVGLCGDLPTVEIPSILGPVDGVTSPSVPINSAPPRPAGNEELASSQDGYLLVLVENANLRSGDDARYTVVAIVEGGAALIALGQNGDGSWWYVQAGEIRGWISNELVAIRGDLSNVPLVPVVGEIARPTLFIHIVQPIYDVPGGSPLCTIAANREYYINWRTDFEPVWYAIEATCGGQEVLGWILGENGSFRNPGEVFIPFAP
ncbi:MAG: SH3 domain-containing protein [Chloroflexi bacterium]|nr:SH3 domain-containing protein [Chloroflexota bacterium]